MWDQIMAVFILATIFGGIALVLGVYFWGVKMTGRLSGKMSARQSEEETKLIQEIYRGLTRMEERIEALETILLEKKKTTVKETEDSDA